MFSGFLKKQTGEPRSLFMNYYDIVTNWACFFNLIDRKTINKIQSRELHELHFL